MSAKWVFIFSQYILRSLPIHNLKIDKSFIKDLTNSTKDQEIAAGILSVVHRLELKLVAEGIETPEQFEFLDSVGCDMGQGYLFSKPLLETESNRIGEIIEVIDEISTTLFSLMLEQSIYNIRSLCLYYLNYNISTGFNRCKREVNKCLSFEAFRKDCLLAMLRRLSFFL